MPARRLRLRRADVEPRAVGPSAVPDELAAAWQRLRDRLGIPGDFPPEVLAEARAAAARGPEVPEGAATERIDRTDLPFLTIDPEGSRDLDQAVCVRAEGDGFRVWYAIADVAAFVRPGGALDREAHRRGQTLYAPDRRTPLHPPELSEDAASLLADADRPALLWSVRLDADGRAVEAGVTRATVRSRARLSYPEAQRALDDPAVDLAGGDESRETLHRLRDVGRLREALEIARGGVSLDLPDQEVERTGTGWRLVYRALLPVEGWNAQISLLTGMAAADLMLGGRVGVLRTLPAADDGAVRRLRRIARALGLDWPTGQPYPDFVRALDPSRPAEAAMLTACTTLFRGAGYTAFDGEAPEHPGHAALAADYAHATAPLRRLVDRYVGEVCLALTAGRPVPAWARAALPALPAAMTASERTAHGYERAVIDLAEVVVLADRVGEVFTGTVVELDDKPGRGRIMITDPAVEARITGPSLELGAAVQARLAAADLEQGSVVFVQA
ncbi:exoribonuclease R [Friedmanniella endophytica]|uniref:Exoribonuclease R n=1 Tax=Microlunatus kandeliicorticis TaxID=1759536 RepID=A0A7W3P609_9ACTN|nr:RNB domain-containing ribonuclease [Microlunatus kandeliicorticis]MBA8794458.1 exoribonuclease R [Microlunatus kandeliicorticis]